MEHASEEQAIEHTAERAAIKALRMKRIIAYIIDHLVPLLLIIQEVSSLDLWNIFVTAAILGAYLMWWGIMLRKGQTPGKQILGLRVVHYRYRVEAHIEEQTPSWNVMFTREAILKSGVSISLVLTAWIALLGSLALLNFLTEIGNMGSMGAQAGVSLLAALVAIIIAGLSYLSARLFLKIFRSIFRMDRLPPHDRAFDMDKLPPYDRALKTEVVSIKRGGTPSLFRR